jgi:hypothetical protein
MVPRHRGIKRTPPVTIACASRLGVVVEMPRAPEAVRESQQGAEIQRIDPIGCG